MALVFPPFALRRTAALGLSTLILMAASAHAQETGDTAPDLDEATEVLAEDTSAAELEAQAAAEAEAAAAAEAAAQAAAAEAAVAACVEIAGTPSAAAPVSRAAQRAFFARLREAEAPCEEALALDPEAGAAAFHLATIALARRDADTAFDLFQQAADAGVAAASTRLGDYYNFGMGSVDTDIDRAVGHYRDAVAGGDAPGTATLAAMYRLGRGVPRDAGEMVRLFEQAADAGYHFAQYQFAQILLTGEGVPEDLAAELSIPDGARAVGYLAGAAEAGNLQATLDLARAYGEGIDGVDPNPEAQFRWTDMAAEAGAPQAIAARAFLYEQGIGTEPDPDRAAAGYVEAIETGEVDPDTMRAIATARPPAWDDATARAFQVILQERGLYDGAIDGIVGRGTMAGAAALAD